MDFEWPSKLLESIKKHPIRTGCTLFFLFILWAIVQFGGTILQEKARQFVSPDKNTKVEYGKVVSGTILATHYPTGELYIVNPDSGHVKLLSARLGEPSALAVRTNGEIVVLDSKQGLVIGVNSKDGSHTFTYTGEALWKKRPSALVLESDRYAVIAVQDYIIRLDLENGSQFIVSQGGLFKQLLGICVDISGKIFVTDIGGKIVEVNPRTGSQKIISEGGFLNHPRGPVVESTKTILIGTAGSKAGIIRVDLLTGQQSVVATGPFITIAGMIMAEANCILVADNGRGADGDGFIAYVNIKKGSISKIVTAQSSDWRFLNGRAVAIIPKI